MIQSVWRYLALPLMVFGIGLAFRKDWRTTAVLGATVLYYLATLAVGHSEIRYGAPMQALLILFAAVAVCWLGVIAGGSGFWKRASWFRLPALTMTSVPRARRRRWRA